MKKILGAIAATALVAALVAPAGAATTKTGCKGKWMDAGVCSFTYEGGGWAVKASGEGGDPMTVVSVRLEVQGPAEGTNVMLLSCGVTVSDGPAECGSTSKANGGATLPYEPQPGDEMTCSVLGAGSGKYRCIAGL